MQKETSSIRKIAWMRYAARYLAKNTFLPQGARKNTILEGILRGNLYVALIAEYKAAGRRKEIEGALKALHWDSREATIPEDLCFLYGVYPEDYLHDVEICQRFAR